MTFIEIGEHILNVDNIFDIEKEVRDTYDGVDNQPVMTSRNIRIISPGGCEVIIRCKDKAEFDARLKTLKNAIALNGVYVTEPRKENK